MTAQLASVPSREPPSNLEAEQVVLGGCLVSPSLLASSSAFLKPEHFFEDIHQRVFAAMLDLHGQGKPANPITLRPFVPAGQVIGSLTVAEYLVRIAQMAAPSQTIATARTLVELYVRREMIATLRESISALDDFPAHSQVDEFASGLAATCSDFAEMVQGREPGTSEGTLGEIGRAVFDGACEIHRGDAPRPPSTGLKALDAKLPMRGLAAGSLYVIAGRPGMGKTMLAGSLARNIAKGGAGSLYISLEVTAGEIAARVMSSVAGLDDMPYSDILSGNLTNNQFHPLADARDAMQGWPLYINDKPGLAMPQIMAMCERMARQWSREGIETKLVVIDHAKLVRPPQEARGNSVEALGIIANSAKVLAKRMGATVALCSQLNRGVEQRDDKRPMMSDLRASGELEEAADAVLLLYRPAYYLMQTPAFKEGDPLALADAAAVFNDLEVNVAKARQGAPGNVQLWCNPGTSDVRDWAR